MGNQVDKRPLLHIRLTEGLRGDLDKEAEKAGRTLTKEVERRLEASLAAPTAGLSDALVYGWVDPAGAKALGDALGMLAGRVADNGSVPGDPELDHPERLAMLRVAIDRVLDHLSASAKLSAEQTTLAELAARQFINDFQRVEPNPAAYSQRSDLAVMAELLRCIWLDRRALDKPKE